MALAQETVYGTPPASGYRPIPPARTTLGADWPLLDSELLGYGRDPLAPIKDALTADGEVLIPIDVGAFGFRLKAAFGQPTTTGTTPKTHTYQSGNWALPSMAIETAMPEVPRFAMHSGCVLDRLSLQMQRSGLLTATARLVAQGETIAAMAASIARTPPWPPCQAGSRCGFPTRRSSPKPSTARLASWSSTMAPGPTPASRPRLSGPRSKACRC